MTTTRNLNHLPALDGLRAVAIFFVLISHSSTQLFGQQGVFESQILSTIASYGRLGVDLFFALSGFLITHRLLAEFQSKGNISLRSFYIRRVFRILPPYLAYLFIILILGAIGLISLQQWEIGSSFLFVRNYFMVWTSGGEATNHFWSLSVEEHFYLLWPFLLTQLKPRTAFWVVPFLALLIQLWVIIDSRYHVFAHFLPDAGPLFRSDARMDALLWGCFAAFVFPQIQAYFVQNWRWGVLAQILLPFILVLVIVFPIPLQHLWLALIFPSIVVCCVGLPDTVLGKILDTHILSWIGQMSYSLYIWQTLFLQRSKISLSLSLGGSSPMILIYWLLDLSLVFTAATLSYYFLERKMTQLGRSISNRKKG